MQLSRIFLLCFVAGIAAGYVSLRARFASSPIAAPGPAYEHATPEPQTSLNEPLIAKHTAPKGSLAEVEEHAPIESLNVTRPGGPTPAAPPPSPLSETQRIRAKADALVAAEPLD